MAAFVNYGKSGRAVSAATPSWLEPWTGEGARRPRSTYWNLDEKIGAVSSCGFHSPLRADGPVGDPVLLPGGAQARQQLQHPPMNWDVGRRREPWLDSCKRRRLEITRPPPITCK